MEWQLAYYLIDISSWDEHSINRSTGTVHEPTSAKGRWRDDVIVVMAMPAQHCSVAQRSRLIPLSVSPNSDESWEQSLYPDGDPYRHQTLIICSLAHCQTSLKISYKSVLEFLRKVVSRQTDKQRRKHIEGKVRHCNKFSDECSHSVFAPVWFTISSLRTDQEKVIWTIILHVGLQTWVNTLKIRPIFRSYTSCPEKDVCFMHSSCKMIQFERNLQKVLITYVLILKISDIWNDLSWG